jgi:hypothetical protein
MFIISYIVVEGEIRDSLNQRVPFAVIRVEELKRGTYSDENGKYYLKLPNGRWTITVSALGKETYKFTVEGKDTTIRYDIFLREKPLQTREIVITAKREEFKKETGQVLRFKAEVIRSAPVFITADIFKTIQDFPGVIPLADFSGKFSVRSGSPSENGVLLDNAVIFNPYHLGGFFSIFDADALESFNFYRSIFPAKFGNFTSSILEMKTIDPDSTYGNLSVSLLASKIFQTYKGKNYGAFISARRSYFDYTLKLIDYDFPYYFYDILGKVYRDFNENWTLSATFMHGRDNFNFNLFGGFLRMIWGNDVISINSRYVMGNWLNFTSISTTNFTNGFSFGFNDQTIASFNAPMNLVNFRTEFSRIYEDLEKNFGFEAHRGWGKFEEDFFASRFEFSGLSYTLSLYGEYLFKRGNYNLSIGLRVNGFLRRIFQDKNRDIVFVNPEPRLSAKYFIGPDLAIKGGFGVYHQYYAGLSGGGGRLGEVLSSFYYWLPVYRGIEPQKSFQYSLGISGITSWGDWEIEAFYKDYPNILLENPNVDPKDIFGTLLRRGKGWAYGFDGYIRKDVGNITGMISYSFLVGRVKIGDSLMNSPYDRRNALIFNISRKFGRGLEMGFRFAYQSGLPYTGVLARYDIYSIYDPGTGLPARLRTQEIYSYPYSLRYPPYHRADVYISKDFKIRAVKGRLSLSVINIYNRKNVFTYFYDYSKDPPQLLVIPQLPLFPSFEIFINW